MGLFFPILVLVAFYSALAQPPPSPFPAGQIIPRVVCAADPSQSYALYLPSTFSNGRKWPIVCVVDPAARGPLAAEVVRAAAEKYGYIVAASNNSRNGLKEGPGPAATAMW